ncbi:zinc finger CCCH domain-containing protein 55 isoform X4 [Arabidopsis lyrata subsp. lyrata]|uniref:zinc finger CCCH domain-containing protein 55 isoform X4 n=1 Tax=Arabidopsis lyrata subsp. lyrata TaxID=81972 RepID=UPI000A29D05C|nr:zinc finger CCCH domain-containing protein 55 isoform X4 [Arabidopsis lyrata subsp. lyrata]|eukprot:XP_020866465.1 zinc finger CCCH domain-containing protein 55 isoform X4 [Arabidopsis lyrata subsp. lyrata]
MDPGGPTATIIERIITLEPENAFKIIGYFLLQDIEDCDLIQLAFGTDQVLKDLCEKAKSVLGILNPNLRPFNPLHQSLSQSSPRNEFLDFSRNPNPLSPSLTSNTFGYNPDFRHEGSSQQQQQQWSNHFPFANLHQRSFSANEPGYQFLPGGLVDGFGSPGGLGSPSERISPNQQQRMIAAHGSPMSNIQGSGQFGVQGREERRYSVSNQLYLTFQPESSFTNVDVKTYFSNFGPVVDVSFPYQEQRTFGFVTFANAETVTTILAGVRLHIIGGSRVTVKPCKQKETIPQKQGSGQFGVQGRQGKRYPASHQLYLTFPPESSFTDEDVSTYFGNFGPVVDVRIPNQERRMFGFVTFANAETVTTVLAQGNSHLIGESAVIVKPYQQKETIPQDSGQQQQLNQLLERENLLHHPRLSGMDPRDQDESRFGPMMFRNPTQEMRQRRNVQADLQQAIEVEDQRRRLLNLKLPDMENKSIHHHQRSPSIASPAHFPSQVREGDSGIGEKDLEQVATSNEEHQGQERSLENTLPDSSFGSSNKSGQTSRV